MKDIKCKRLKGTSPAARYTWETRVSQVTRIKYYTVQHVNQYPSCLYTSNIFSFCSSILKKLFQTFLFFLDLKFWKSTFSTSSILSSLICLKKNHFHLCSKCMFVYQYLRGLGCLCTNISGELDNAHQYLRWLGMFLYQYLRWLGCVCTIISGGIPLQKLMGRIEILSNSV